MKRKSDPTKPSPTLAAVRKEWEIPKRDERLRRWLAQIPPYPHGVRAEVFCWLWANHAELSEMLRRWKPTWASVAQIMEMDGVRDRYGKAPTGNAVRRVWGRVCREIEAEQAKKGPR